MLCYIFLSFYFFIGNLSWLKFLLIKFFGVMFVLLDFNKLYFFDKKCKNLLKYVIIIEYII